MNKKGGGTLSRKLYQIRKGYICICQPSGDGSRKEKRIIKGGGSPRSLVVGGITVTIS